MKRLSALAVVALVVLAGCSGGGGTTTQPSNAPLPDTSPAPTTPGETTDGPPSGDGSVNETELVRAHLGRLAGHNHTVAIRQRVGANRSRLVAQRSARGVPAIVEYNATNDANYTTVFTGSAVVQRVVAGGSVAYREPDVDPGSPPSSRSILGQVFGDATFRANGTVTRDGQTLYRFSAGLSDLTRQFSGAEPTAFDADLLVTEAGIIEHVDYRLVVDRGDGGTVLGIEMDIRDIDETRVTPPGWLEEAAEVLNESGPPSRTVSDADLGATLTVTGEQSAIDAVSLRNASAPFYESDIVDAARVSALVRPVAPQPVDNATVTIDYDESLVPDGDERGLWVFVYNETYKTFVQMETTIDPENNTVRASQVHPDVSLSVDGETVRPKLNGIPEGSVFVVMHAQTYWEAYDRNSG